MWVHPPKTTTTQRSRLGHGGDGGFAPWSGEAGEGDPQFASEGDVMEWLVLVLWSKYGFENGQAEWDEGK